MFLKNLTLLWISVCISYTAAAGEIRAAVAANFTVPAQKIAEQFQRDTGHIVKLSFGATGKFYAQIQAGAPFDVLLAADEATPRKMAAEGMADPKSIFTYAIGKLVLWSKKSGFVDNAGHILHGNFGKLAIADPKLAPYGLAAQETLENLHLWNKIQNRLVFGENISQTMQFADTGNADLAFIALSQTLQDGKTIAGSFWQVPSHLYRPIRQDAINLSKSHDPTAAAFLEYLKSAPARAVIQEFGYLLP